MSVDVATLRRDLEANNGMPGLEMLQPDQVDAAVRIFYRDGFVVVRDVLTADQVRFLRQGCEREAAEVVAMDPNRNGNRHRNRYSWGGASLTNSVLHREEWVMLVPREMFDLLSEHGRRISESVVTDEPLTTGYTFDPARKKKFA